MKKSRVLDFRGINRERFIEAISDIKKFIPNKDENDWFDTIKRFPEKLLYILLIELKLGNNIKLIQNCDWPQEGSIVIGLASGFKKMDWCNFEGVEYRDVNDPHYWMADVGVKINGVEHLIIV